MMEAVATLETGRPQWPSNKQIASIIAVLTLLGGIHGGIMVPIIRETVAEDIDKAVAKHASRPHVGAVHRHELESLTLTIDRIEKKVDRILERRGKP